MVTERDIAILQAVCRYYVLSRQQIQRLCFATDPNGRIARRRLQLLVDAKLLNRHECSVYSISHGTPGAAYYPSRKGCEFLAEYFDDEQYLATPTRMPIAHHLFHWLTVSETHWVFDEALARQEDVKIECWLNEWDICNPQESVPEKRYSLFTLLRETPRLVAAPDSAFLLSMSGHSKVFYIEQDRNTSGVRQISASKPPGYAEMALRKMHRRHFPAATVETFTVLMIAPTERRRDALRKGIHGKPGSELWKFVSQTDLTPENVLHGSIFFPCEGEPRPLVKKVEQATPTTTQSS